MEHSMTLKDQNLVDLLVSSIIIFYSKFEINSIDATLV